VIIPSSGETAVDISTARCVPFDNILLGGDLTIIRLKEQDGRFFSYQLNGVRKLDIARIAQGVSVVHLYGDNLKRLKVTFPTIAEQNKISVFLSLVDKRIETQSRAIEKLQSLISGITQKVSKHPSVQKTMLSDVLMERNEKNQKHLPVYSVSVSEGVINQVEYLGRSFAAKDTSNYNVVYFGDIVYTKSPTGDFPFGIVKRSNNAVKVAVSPLYGVYQPASEDIGIYLHYYFCSSLNAKNYLHKLIQKGAKNTINITNQRFLENEVPIPDPLTLRKYVVLMTSLSKKLEQEKNLLALLQTQKQFLLQEMFI
jgi:type I restriction enzyme S subunit